MPRISISLSTFLSRAKTAFLSLSASSTNPFQWPLTIVTGNSAADLDSLTSALLYAYIRSLPFSPANADPKNQPPPPPLYVPLLNIPRADLALRPEFQAVFRHTGILAEGLVTLDEFETFIDKGSRTEDTEWVLVDHNKLQGALGEKFSSRVRGVVDHHEDEGAVPMDAETRVIEKCGSCTSLVIRTLRASWEDAAAGGTGLSSGPAPHAQGEFTLAEDDENVTRGWDAQVAKMALASILIDTANLTAEGKVERADRDAVAFLEAKIALSPKDAVGWDRGAFYREVEAAKADIEGLGFRDVLRKDYKQWIEKGLGLGISSVVKPLEFVARKALLEGTDDDEDAETEFAAKIGGFMAERDLTVFAIMTAFTSDAGHFQRELYLQALSAGHAAASRFTEEAGKELGLENHHAIQELQGRPGAMKAERERPWQKMWIQREVGKSRKQVAPLLRRAMGRESA
ncbi:MAG: hypothetical protein LQ341_005225 [Variospora aurantia]|nr:MAG: hypothetical protein LQ341_005225 [Variospora aurantia]